MVVTDVEVGEMTERYVASGGYGIEIWHNDSDCHMVSTTELVPIEESEIPDSARACSGCADGIDAQQLRKKMEEA